MVIVLMVPTLAVAQVERYELGRRLRLFEAAWEKWDCHEARQRALPLLRPLTGQFFSFRFAEAGRTLDRATFTLQAADGPPAGRRWAAALQIVPQSRLLDETTTELIVTVQPFYQPDVPLPSNARLRLWFTNQSTVSVAVQTWPVTVRVPLPPLNDHTGLDRRLYVLLDVRGNLEPASVGISQVRHLRARLERLKAACDKLPRHCELEAATIRTRLQAWQAALQGETPITDFPYALWLDNAELMAAGRPFFTPERQGQFWITLPTGSAGSVPCRLFVPKGLQKHQPVPLVVALHGAGVDENMFFDSYGAGQIVRECQQRGWMLLSPRAGLLGPPPVPQLIDTLAQRYPIDRKRVFLVGHSMGAAHAMAVALRQPDAYTAVAALGGAPRIAQVQALQRLPFFLAVGTHDSLAINGARKLHQQLTTAQLPHYHYREYPELEHLLIVRQALPDVFAFFDKFVKPTP